MKRRERGGEEGGKEERHKEKCQVILPKASRELIAMPRPELRVSCDPHSGSFSWPHRISQY